MSGPTSAPQIETALQTSEEEEFRAEKTYEAPMAMSHDHPTELGDNGTLVPVQIGPRHFDLLKLLGEGAFGKVLLVRNRLDHRIHAMKVISKSLLRKKNNVQYMKSEREILTKLNHPFLVSLHFAFQSESKLFLVMDFLAGGELFLHLRRKGLILEKEVQFYAAEIILALEFLHNHNIVHRDLKPENILLRSDGHVCITDFGLAKEIGDGVSTRTLCGTSEYMAPEMISRAGYGKAVDYWALGALAFEMLTGKPPFTAKTQKELDHKILTSPLSLPPYLTAACTQLLRGLLERDSLRRLGCARGTMFQIGGVHMLKQHAFFGGINWQDVEAMRLHPPIPILLSSSLLKGSAAVAPATAPATAATVATSVNEDWERSGLDVSQGLDDENKRLNEELTQYFAADFTKRVISRSIVDDTLTPLASPLRSPCRSPPPSSPTAGRNDFEGFEYTSNHFLCSALELESFEEALRQRSLKADKKRQHREKQKASKEQEAAQRLAEEQAAKARREAEEAKRREAEAQRREMEAQRAAAEEKRRRAIAHNERVEAYQQALGALQKKIKGARKKLKDILDLQTRAKLSTLDADQQAKLARLAITEKEVASLEAQEHDLQTANPGPLLPLDEEAPSSDRNENGLGEKAANPQLPRSTPVPTHPAAGMEKPATGGGSTIKGWPPAPPPATTVKLASPPAPPAPPAPPLTPAPTPNAGKSAAKNEWSVVTSPGKAKKR